ncbi:MAG: hypothetical protein ABSD10_00600 [Candidatus Saccharimonadales bacterium]|jgi:hypothetical protein
MEGELVPEAAEINIGWSITAGHFDPDTTRLTPEEMENLDDDWARFLADVPRAKTLASQAVLDALRECSPELFPDDASEKRMQESIEGVAAVCEGYSFAQRNGDLKQEAWDLDLETLPVVLAARYLLDQSTIDQPRTEEKERFKFKPLSKRDVSRFIDAIVRYLYIQQEGRSN